MDSTFSDSHNPKPANPFQSVPIEIVVCVGKARPLVRDLVNLTDGSVLTLDRTVEDPVELFIGERLIARGVLEEQSAEGSGSLGVRLTEIIDKRQELV
ncbi:MAG: FliM/FliN family flagellar motor switch protein [Paracoccaceae bacterium]